MAALQIFKSLEFVLLLEFTKYFFLIISVPREILWENNQYLHSILKEKKKKKPETCRGEWWKEVFQLQETNVLGTGLHLWCFESPVTGATIKRNDQKEQWREFETVSRGEQLKQERSSEEGYCHLQISKVPKGFSFFSFLFFWIFTGHWFCGKCWLGPEDIRLNIIHACLNAILSVYCQEKHVQNGDFKAGGAIPTEPSSTFPWGNTPPLALSSAQQRSCPDHPGNVKCYNYILSWHHVLLLYSTHPHCNFAFICAIIWLKSVSPAKLQGP